MLLYHTEIKLCFTQLSAPIGSSSQALIIGDIAHIKPKPVGKLMRAHGLAQ